MHVSIYYTYVYTYIHSMYILSTMTTHCWRWEIIKFFQYKIYYIYSYICVYVYVHRFISKCYRYVHILLIDFLLQPLTDSPNQIMSVKLIAWQNLIKPINWIVPPFYWIYWFIHPLSQQTISELSTLSANHWSDLIIVFFFFCLFVLFLYFNISFI